MRGQCHLFVKGCLQLVKNVLKEWRIQLAGGFPGVSALKSYSMPAISSASLRRKYLLRRSRSWLRALQDRAFTAATLKFRASAVCCTESPSISLRTKTTLKRECSCFSLLRRTSHNSAAPFNVAIAKLRAALGDSADNPRYVETLPRRGYRFIAEVAVVNPPSTEPELTSAAGSSAADVPAPFEVPADMSRLGILQLWKVLGGTVVLLLAILAVWIFFWRNGVSANPPSSTLIASLAVLPLENLSGNSEDYFADRMTDELITDPAQISALRLISRAAIMTYKGALISLRQIARELNGDAVVEGTVLRSGSQVRITAQLIRAPVDKHVWAQSYEGDLQDTLALQKKVAREIADQIRINVTPSEAAVLDNTKPVNPEAYENYLKGRYFWNKRTADDTKKAIDYFNQAIKSDPNYAFGKPKRSRKHNCSATGTLAGAYARRFGPGGGIFRSRG